MKIKIAILGSRGIPNAYGGFEQFAEYLSVGLVERGMEVWVYCSHTHPFQQPEYHGVHLIHCKDPEDRMGTVGQFLYDLHCIVDSRKRGFDVILQLGYTSSSVWHWLLPRSARIITNMDGLEWKRSKYNVLVRRFLKFAERLAVKHSHALVADSEAIAEYLMTTYHAPSTFIPYGAEIPENPDAGLLQTLDLEPGKYYLLIARMQPDNHIEEAIQGVLASETPYPLVVVGNVNNGHGRYLTSKYTSPRIIFTGGIFDLKLLNALRYHCRLYFHGHSAGGTNPSLLEAMAASAPICAHDNPFNRAVLGEDGFYFKSIDDISKIIGNCQNPAIQKDFIKHNLQKLKTKYTWIRIVVQYERLIQNSKNH
jgi:glycosyltransferase involved in cell wall biosynthesis